MNQFQILANATSKLFSKEELSLDFSGYNDFLDKYNTLNSYDAECLSEVVKESILWNDYISEVINTVNVLLFSHMTDHEALDAGNASDKKKDPVFEKVEMLKRLKKEMYVQKRHCINIYYQTMKTYEKSMKAFTINDYISI